MYIELEITIKKFKQYSDIYIYNKEIEDKIKTEMFLRGYEVKKIELGYIPIIMYNLVQEEYKYTYNIDLKKIRDDAETINLKEGTVIKQNNVNQSGAGWFFLILVTAILGVIAIEITSIQVIKVVSENADNLQKVSKSNIGIIISLSIFIGIIAGGIYFIRKS